MKTKNEKKTGRQEHLRVVVRCACEMATGAPSDKRFRKHTFWACKWERVGSVVRFTECDADGFTDARAVSSGNGGVVRVTVCDVADIVSVRCAQYNGLYGELEVVPSNDAAVIADHDTKFREITGRRFSFGSRTKHE